MQVAGDGSTGSIVSHGSIRTIGGGPPSQAEWSACTGLTELFGSTRTTGPGDAPQRPSHKISFLLNSIDSIPSPSRPAEDETRDDHCEVPWPVSPKDDDIAMSPKNSSVRNVTKRRKVKLYSNPTPSSHCHICQRSSTSVPVVTCKNLDSGTCRKVVCALCFNKQGWDWSGAKSQPSLFVCPHCRGECPQRAQCYTYMRANVRRQKRRVLLRKQFSPEPSPTLLLKLEVQEKSEEVA
mmetsp:Transcript_11661/g.23709  ORF Transcript_11661/g.23709 Transcript_11661/m.23709 type:complete len:237 (+) Transcript_11661:442-1152(+)